MNITVDVEIAKPKEIIWNAITDIENSSNMISSILDIEVLNQPADGLVDFKWKETRAMFGKESSEIMWVTDSVDNDYYCTRAESHGSVYITKLSLSEVGAKTRLTMSFTGEAQTFFVKLISACMCIFIKGSMKKALLKDLNEIKEFVEN